MRFNAIMLKSVPCDALVLTVCALQSATIGVSKEVDDYKFFEVWLTMAVRNDRSEVKEDSKVVKLCTFAHFKFTFEALWGLLV